MGAPRKAFPSYPRRPHKKSGRAVIRVWVTPDRQRDIYLDGPIDSPESVANYDRLKAEAYFTSKSAAGLAPISAPTGSVLVKDVAAAYLLLRRAEQSPKELFRTTVAMRLLLECYADVPAVAFGAAELESVGTHGLKERDCAFCTAGQRNSRPCKSCSATGRQRWARTYLNRLLSIIKACWDWGVKTKMVPVSSLRSVRGIRRGTPGAREKKPVRLVPRKVVQATQKHCGRILRDMIELQYLTGMRPEEVCELKRGDVRRDGVLPEVGKFRGVWVYDVVENKNAWRGHTRVVFFGPKAQKVLRRYLKRSVDAFIFVPLESSAEWFAKAGRRHRTERPRLPGQSYPVNSYRQSILRACERAKTEAWTPLRLRHLRATEIRAAYGPDAARVVLGHSLGSITGVYAEADLAAAAKVMRAIG